MFPHENLHRLNTHGDSSKIRFFCVQCSQERIFYDAFPLPRVTKIFRGSFARHVFFSCTQAILIYSFVSGQKTESVRSFALVAYSGVYLYATSIKMPCKMFLIYE